MSERPSTSQESMDTESNHDEEVQQLSIQFNNITLEPFENEIENGEYVFYEVHEAAAITHDPALLADELLVYRGIKVNLVGAYMCNQDTRCHYLVSHTAQDKSLENPAKIYMEMERVQDRPDSGTIVEVTGFLTWKNNENVLEVHALNILDERIIDRYVRTCRNLKAACGSTQSFGV